jgi:ribonuclease P/MRP protein subunit POP5
LGLGIETWPDAVIDRYAFQRAIWDAARGLLGDPGSADCDLTVMDFRFEEGLGAGEAIVRVRRDERERGRAALSCVTAIDGQPIGLLVRGTSGTVRACERRYLGRYPDSKRETTVRFAGVDRPAVGGVEAGTRSKGDERNEDERLDVRTEEGPVGATSLDVESHLGNRMSDDQG